MEVVQQRIPSVVVGGTKKSVPTGAFQPDRGSLDRPGSYAGRFEAGLGANVTRVVQPVEYAPSHPEGKPGTTARPGAEMHPVAPRLSPQQAALGLMLGAILLMVFLLRPFALSPSRTPKAAESSQPPASAPVGPSGGGALSPVFTPEVRYWSDSIIRWSGVLGLDPNLVATVMQIESCGNPQAMSGAGATGLFQVMPFHFKPGEDRLNPEVNAVHGLQYLKQGLTLANGDAGLALAGYNGGHGVIGKTWSAWANETQRYYAWGSGLYRDATSGQTTSSTLAQWLAAGGRSLCQRAHIQLGLP